MRVVIAYCKNGLRGFDVIGSSIDSSVVLLRDRRRYFQNYFMIIKVSVY